MKAEDYLKLVENWEDPNPKPIVEEYDGFHVVRDDLLGYGSKARFIDYLIRETPVDEWVFGGANKVGWGPIALAKVCSLYGKSCTVFWAKRGEPTWHQQKYLELGGKIEWVNMGMLNVTLSRAKKYWEENPTKRAILPIGLEHPTVLGSIIKVARSLPISPKEIWTVGSSGTLSRGLQLAFPDAEFNLVQTGHKMNEREIGKGKLFVSPYKFDQECKQEELPPFPSEKYYDAKVWSFVKKYGKPGALIWNVA